MFNTLTATSVHFDLTVFFLVGSKQSCIKYKFNTIVQHITATNAAWNGSLAIV